MNELGQFKINQIYWGDALELMKLLPSDCIDLIITDPPFGIGFKATRRNYNRTAGRVLEGYREIPRTEYLEFSRQWLHEAHRTLKPSGSLYVFSGWNNLKDLLIALDEVGFITINHLIWKYQFGVFTRRKFVTSHYHILFVVKDSERYKFNKIEHYPEDVWFIKREYWTGKIKTPTKLPGKLVEKIILYSSDRGDLVFDPFVGSGTVCEIARSLGRNFLGFEIVKEYYDFACQRIAKI
ncbi:MAG: site-specific DNA-methyltransferase [Candidatus Sumerlaeia bacterium]|nr:site-specific DNA-methyltransferase [Candidatus Sumerlaeia bacterium]